jgi:hypothetical protein
MWDEGSNRALILPPYVVIFWYRPLGLGPGPKLLVKEPHEVRYRGHFTHVEAFLQLDAQLLGKIVAEGQFPIKPTDHRQFQVFIQPIAGEDFFKLQAGILADPLIDEFGDFTSDALGFPKMAIPFADAAGWSAPEHLINSLADTAIGTEITIGGDRHPPVIQLVS